MNNFVSCYTYFFSHFPTIFFVVDFSWPCKYFTHTYIHDLIISPKNQAYVAHTHTHVYVHICILEFSYTFTWVLYRSLFESVYVCMHVLRKFAKQILAFMETVYLTTRVCARLCLWNCVFVYLCRWLYTSISKF